MCKKNRLCPRRENGGYTPFAVAVGILLAALFSATNTYLGLKVGRGVSVNIPAVIAAAYLTRKFVKRTSPQENALSQAMASIGEGVSCGLLFPLPALLIIGQSLDLHTALGAGILGGFAGVLFFIPMRAILLEQSGLAFPESKAIAQVLSSVTQTADKKSFRSILMGMGVGGLYKLGADSLGLWSSKIEYRLTSLKNAVLGFDVVGSLIGIGFVVGPEISMVIAGGAIFTSMVLIPLISYLAELAPQYMAVGGVLISTMDAAEIRQTIVQYIGIGAVAVGGLISVLQTVPMFSQSFKEILCIRHNAKVKKKEDLSFTWTALCAVFMLFSLCAWFWRDGGFPIAVLTLICTFLLSLVAGRVVGILGNGNSPISGMTVAAVLVLAAGVKLCGGMNTEAGMATIIITASIVSVGIGVSSNASQSLKVTQIIGGDVRKTQMAMLICVPVCALVSSGVVLLLVKLFGIGTVEVPAPQAHMIATMVQGIITGELPWELIGIGGMLAAALWLMRLPVLSVAIGIYLPAEISTSLLLGAVLRWAIEKFAKKGYDRDAVCQRGTLVASGLIAGDALFGIFAGVLALVGWRSDASLFANEHVGTKSAVVSALLLLGWFYYYVTHGLCGRGNKKKQEDLL